MHPKPFGVKWIEGYHKFTLMALYEAMPGSISQGDIVAWFERNGINGSAVFRLASSFIAQE